MRILHVTKKYPNALGGDAIGSMNLEKQQKKLGHEDSWSGMWIFKRSIWPKLNVKSSGMPFSQELKIEAYRNGFKCTEVPIVYRARVGEVKLNTFKDGLSSIFHLLNKRIFG